jgi:hypothetical protein
MREKTAKAQLPKIYRSSKSRVERHFNSRLTFIIEWLITHSTLLPQGGAA